MTYANTKQVRAILREAFKETGVYLGTTWTDPVKWGSPDGKKRVVTFEAGYSAASVAVCANKLFEKAGYSNRARPNPGADGDGYVKVNADLA